MKNTGTKKLIFTSLFAALICVATFAIKIPWGNGYIHLGDSLNYLASCILPFPFGVFSGGIGGALADLLAGYHMYIIPTLIVKMLNSACFYILFTYRQSKLVCIKNIIAVVLTTLVTVFGYFVAEIILYGLPGALLTLVPSLIQGIGAGVLFFIIAAVLDKTGLTFKMKNSLK